MIADALTSVLAIAALLAGRWLGWNWLDPLMGLVGAALIALRNIVTINGCLCLSLQSVSMAALESLTPSTVTRGLNSRVKRCSGRQNSLIILKSMWPVPTAW